MNMSMMEGNENNVRKTVNERKNMKNSGSITKVSQRYHRGITKYHKGITENVEEMEDDKNDEKIWRCEHCDKDFTHKNNYYRHLKHYCIEKKNSDTENILLKQKNMELEEQNKKLMKEKYEAIIDEKDKCIEIVKQHNKVINTSTHNINNQNIDNSRTTNYLNITLPNMIDIDTFMDNLMSSHRLSNEQTRLLLESFNTCGLISYGNCLSRTLKENCYQQMKDMDKNNNGVKMIPLVTTDSNLRSHKERHMDGWKKVDNDKKINDIISISNDQVYEDHHEHIYLGSKERKKVGNIIKKDHGINEIKKKLEGEQQKYVCSADDISEYLEYRSNMDRLEEENIEDYSSYPEFDSANNINKITDCGREYLYDKDDNVFNPEENNMYVGRRIFDKKFNVFYVEYKN
tara:strand:- start:2381 stop:3586 length:1206 start_codon:yes stop_codon:yes gene_type:complete